MTNEEIQLLDLLTDQIAVNREVVSVLLEITSALPVESRTQEMVTRLRSVVEAGRVLTVKTSGIVNTLAGKL